MKYAVEVNAKWLVSIEAESAYQAEHKVLDLDGIWGALAFDKDMIKTDTFIGAVQFCEMISMDELKDYVDQYEVAWHEFALAKDKHKVCESEVERLEAMLAKAKESLRKATEEMNNAEEHARNMTRHLGRQPE